MVPVPGANKDKSTGDQAAAPDLALFDMDLIQPGEIHLHSWMLYTSQVPVLDLTHKTVKTTKDFEQVFHELNLCTETKEEDALDGRKASQKEDRTNRSN